MTSASKKRGPQTYNGLKALMLTGGLGASLLGTRLIARSEESSASQEAVPAEIVEVTVEPTREFSLGALQPIPTVVSAYVVQEATPEPTNSAAPGNVPAQGGGVAAPAAAAAVSPAIPTVVAIGALPPIPQPSSGGGGGGGGNNGGGGGGNGGGGGGGAVSQSS